MRLDLATKGLEGGFTHPATDAARAFRCVMEATARPGSIHRLAGAMPPAPLSPAAAATLLVLCDNDTPLYLAGAADCAAVSAWIAFHTGAPFADAAHCMFAVGTWRDLAPLGAYSIGTADYPDRSATLIVEMDSLSNSGAELRGPGIRGRAALSLPEAAAFRANHALYPRGLDFILTCGDRIAALPRSTEVI